MPLKHCCAGMKKFSKGGALCDIVSLALEQTWRICRKKNVRDFVYFIPTDFTNVYKSIQGFWRRIGQAKNL